MAWSMQYLKFQVSNDEEITIFEQSVWWWGWLKRRIHGSESAKIRMLQDFSLGRVDSKGGSSVFYHLANSADVVCMCMGNHDQADLEIQFRVYTEYSGCISCRIKKSCHPEFAPTQRGSSLCRRALSPGFYISFLPLGISIPLRCHIRPQLQIHNLVLFYSPSLPRILTSLPLHLILPPRTLTPAPSLKIRWPTHSEGLGIKYN